MAADATTPFTLKIKSKSATMQKSAFINNGKTCENRWFMMEKTTGTKMFTEKGRRRYTHTVSSVIGKKVQFQMFDYGWLHDSRQSLL